MFTAFFRTANYCSFVYRYAKIYIKMYTKIKKKKTLLLFSKGKVTGKLSISCN